MRKTATTHPYLVKAELPIGHGFGSKKKITIRNSRFKTLTEAVQERNILLQTGCKIVLVFDKKKLIIK